MSFYNLMFGSNPLGKLYLGMCGLTPESVGRYRDAYVEKTEYDPEKSEFDSSNGGGRWVLHVYTRNGGGNREHYDDDDFPEGLLCGCTGCIASYVLPSHPLYLDDQDDDFDCTYATFQFQIPGQFWPFLEELTDASSEEVKPAERWARLFQKLDEAPDDPEVKNAMSVMAPILDKIAEALKETD